MNIEEPVNELEKIKEMFIHLKNYGWINDIKREIDVDKAIESIETLLTAYEKEKEKNKELSNNYDKLAKECNEENRRCMLLAVENQDLKEKNKKLNILRLELIISQIPDTTETYKKYKKELDELLKEE